MIYFSELLNREVVTADGKRVGFLSDLTVSRSEVFPRVTALVISRSRARAKAYPENWRVVPSSHLRDLETSPIVLQVTLPAFKSFSLSPEDLLVGRDILDKQIIDTRGRRIVKVNDVKLAKIANVPRLLGADISLQAFLRRLGANGIGRAFALRGSERLIPWNFIEPLRAEESNVRLTIPHSRLEALHPADIADLIEQLTLPEAAAVWQGLPTAAAAGALSELEPSLQGPLLESIGSENASNMLESLPPDEAADILGDLPSREVEDILSHMEAEEANDLRQLLEYDERSAGGVMTTEFLRVKRDWSVERAVAELRRAVSEPEVSYHLFVVDDDEHLVGVVSLRDLVLSVPSAKIEEIMEPNVIVTWVNADQEEVARLMTRYNLVEVPVVDNENRLLGIVTVDDVMDVLLEEASEDISQIAGIGPAQEDLDRHILVPVAKRLVWMVLALAGGLAAGLAMQGYAQSVSNIQSLVYFIPVLILVAGEAVLQTSVIAGRAGDSEGYARVGIRELRTSLAMAGISGSVIAFLTYLWTNNALTSLIFALSLVLTIMIAAFGSIAFHYFASRVPRHRSIFSGAVLAPLVAVISVVIVLVLAGYLSQHVA